MLTFDLPTAAGRPFYVGGLAVSPAGNAVAAWGCGAGVLVPDVTRPADQVPLGDVDHAAFAAGGRLLAVATAAHRRLVVYDVTAGRPADRPTPADFELIASVAGARDGEVIAVGGFRTGGCVVRWHLAAGAELSAHDNGAADVPRVGLSADGMVLATAVRGTVRTWVFGSGKAPKRATATANLSAGWANQVAVAADGRAVAVASRKAAVGFDPTSGAATFVTPASKQTVTDLAFDPTGRRLATVDGTDVVAVWDLPDPPTAGDPPPKCKPAKKLDWRVGPVSAVAFAAAGTVGAAAGQRGRVVVWDLG